MSGTEAPGRWPDRKRGGSPCIDICQIHPEARLCVGCLRTIDEIAAWGAMSADARAAILAELPGRAPRLTRRRGGRRGRGA